MKVFVALMLAVVIVAAPALADHTNNPLPQKPVDGIINPTDMFQFVSGNTGGSGGGAIEFDYYQFNAQSGVTYIFSNDPADGGFNGVTPWKSVHTSTGGLVAGTFTMNDSLTWAAPSNGTFYIKQHNDSSNSDYTLAYRGVGIPNVPEPGILALLGAGIAAVGIRRARRRKAS